MACPISLVTPEVEAERLDIQLILCYIQSQLGLHATLSQKKQNLSVTDTVSRITETDSPTILRWTILNPASWFLEEAGGDLGSRCRRLRCTLFETGHLCSPNTPRSVFIHREGSDWLLYEPGDHHKPITVIAMAGVL